MTGKQGLENMTHTGYIDYKNDMRTVNDLPKELWQIVDSTVSRKRQKNLFRTPHRNRGDQKDSVHKKKSTYPINKQDF